MQVCFFEFKLNHCQISCALYIVFTKHRERIQKFRETGYLKHLHTNEFSWDLAKRTISDKILKDRAYDIARNCGYDGYQRVLASMVYKFFDKETRSGAGAISKVRISLSEQLAEELNKP